MTALSILCVSRVESYAWPFLARMERLADELGAQLVVAGDGPDAIQSLIHGPIAGRFVGVQSKGYIESVLDQALSQCDGNYVLRLDDDETCSPAMRRWLARGSYITADHWKFPRLHLWPDREHALRHPHLWPDHQTRLSIKEKAGGRRTVHAGSPYGGGELAPVAIEHWKFLLKSFAERRAIAEQYDRVMNGAGTGGMLPFSLPELAYTSALVARVNDGSDPWEPTETKELSWTQ